MAPTGRIGKLNRRLVEDLRAVGGAESERTVQLASQLGTGEGESGQILRGLAGYQARARGSAQSLRVGLGREIVKSDPDIIQQRGTDGTRVVQHGLNDVRI